MPRYLGLSLRMRLTVRWPAGGILEGQEYSGILIYHVMQIRASAVETLSAPTGPPGK